MEMAAGGSAGQGRGTDGEAVGPEGMPLGISSGRGHRPAVIDGRHFRSTVAGRATYPLTSAITRTGLPVPPTSFSGAATRTAPVGGGAAGLGGCGGADLP